MIFGFLESNRLIEVKARHLRAEVTSLNLTEDQKQKYGIFIVPENANFIHEKEHHIFETQKTNKAYRNLANQLNASLDKIETNYKLNNKTQLPNIIEGLEKWLFEVTTLKVTYLNSVEAIVKLNVH